MNRIFILAALLVFVSCKGIEGNFTAHENLYLSDEVVPMGDYEADLKAKDNGKVKLKIEGNGEKYKLKFELPENRSFPGEGGHEYYSAEEINEPYGLMATVEKNVETSRKFRGYESCSYREPYHWCDNNGCYTDYRTYYGHQDVIYRLRTTTKGVVLDFRVAEDAEPAATFDGTKKKVRKIYEYIGTCR